MSKYSRPFGGNATRQVEEDVWRSCWSRHEGSPTSQDPGVLALLGQFQRPRHSKRQVHHISSSCCMSRSCPGYQRYCGRWTNRTTRLITRYVLPNLSGSVIIQTCYTRICWGARKKRSCLALDIGGLTSCFRALSFSKIAPTSFPRTLPIDPADCFGL